MRSWPALLLTLLTTGTALAGPAPQLMRPAELPMGERVTLEISNLPSSARVLLLNGTPGPGPCVGSACLDLTSPTVVARSRSDGTGTARFTLRVPGSDAFIGTEAHLQAAVFIGGSPVPSNVVSVTFGAPPVDGPDVLPDAEMLGCTDPTASNHDPAADADDGRCTWPVTFQLDLRGDPRAARQPYVAGPFNGWCGSCTPLSDPDGDDVFEASVPLPAGEHEFLYTVDGWSGEAEAMTVGDPCTRTSFGYTNRVISHGPAPQTLLPHGWLSCPTGRADVTFQLDDRCGTRRVGATEQPFVTGDTLDAWCGGCNPLSDPDEDDVWTTTRSLPAGSAEFKYTLDGWATPEDLEEGMTCTLTSNSFTNRRIFVGGDLTVAPAPFDGCGSCTEVVDESFDILEEPPWVRASHYLGDTQLDPASAVVQGGVCDLELANVGGGWVGAEVHTREEYTHRRWTARMAGPTEPGSVCAFFTYDAFIDSSPDGWGSHEIDFEILDGTVWVGTYAGWHPSDGYRDGALSTVDPGRISREASIWTPPAGFDLTAFHDYTIDWSPDVIRFWVDDRLIDTITEAVPYDDMTLRMNHWTTATWPEVQGPPPAGSTLHCRIAHVRGAPLP